MVSRTRLNPIFAVLEAWANDDHGEVKVHDFGGSRTVLPVPDMASGSYLTSSICILTLPGKDQIDPLPKLLELRNKQDRRESHGVIDMDNGWKIIAVEFHNGTTPTELIAALEKAKETLLAAR